MSTVGVCCRWILSMDNGAISSATHPSIILPSAVGLPTTPVGMNFGGGFLACLFLSFSHNPSTCHEILIPDTKYRIMTPDAPSSSDVRLLPEHVVARPKRAIVVVARPKRAIVLLGPSPSLSRARLRKLIDHCRDHDTKFL